MALFSIQTFATEAQEAKLEKGDLHIYTVPGTVKAVDSLCPADARCATDGTLVRIELKLNGCVTRLGLTSYKAVHNDDNTVDIYFSAILFFKRVLLLDQSAFKKGLWLISQKNKLLKLLAQYLLFMELGLFL